MLYTKQLNNSPYKTVLEFDVDDIKHKPFAAALSQIYQLVPNEEDQRI